MARKQRVHFAGAFYHVIARGNKGAKVFKSAQDYKLYLRFLREYKSRYPFLLYAYVLMPTHVHLLIEVLEIPLSKIMQSLQFRYTRHYNLNYRSWGHLFQGRYKAILCEKDPYFLELSAYIHLNPVRAGLKKDPSDYPWSSHKAYALGAHDDLLDQQSLLAQFSKRPFRAREEFVRFVRSRMGEGKREEFYKARDQRFLGSEEFVEGVQER
jgi:putative transposase